MSLYALGDKSPRLTANDKCWIAPNAQLIGDVVLAENTSIWFGCVLRGDIERISIGANSNIQDNSVLHTDAGYPLTVGENNVIGHMVMLHGCTIGNDTLIGIGATVLNGAKIGNRCLIGAHALVPENMEIEDNSLVLGAPAKIIKPLPAKYIDEIKAGAAHYVENWQHFKKSLKPLS